MSSLRDSYNHAMKQGDREPSIKRQLISKNDGSSISMAGATAKFLMMDANGNEKINTVAVIESPESDGIVRYDWESGDTSESGIFDAEFQITFSSGKIHTMPNDGYIKVEITEELGV